MIEVNRIYQEDALAFLKRLPENFVDSIVTDPPAGISFMGKEWDHHKGGRDAWIEWMAEIAAECLRVIKPGAHALVWSLPRTSHWTATAWENAGFEVRDRIAHVFGSGFPKSLDVSKAIDKDAGHWRGRAGKVVIDAQPSKGKEYERSDKGSAITAAAAAAWSGWGTALKPAMEDWWLLRKPLIGTVAENVLKYGTGALNIDASRVGTEERTYTGSGAQPNKLTNHGKGDTGIGLMDGRGKDLEFTVKGRWPSHLIHDGSEEVVALFPASNGQQGAVGPEYGNKVPVNTYGPYGPRNDFQPRNDFGSAARFFYCAKADRAEREYGLEGMGKKDLRWSSGEQSPGTFQSEGTNRSVKNHHPTVKPLALMSYLIRLITPPGGIVVDPFAGSGSTCVASIRRDFQFIASEAEADYCAIAQKRIDAERMQMKLAL